MPENIALKLKVEVLPFGTLRATERVLFEGAGGADREQITERTTTADCESVPTSLPYVLR